jgi:glucosamine--fructose-6-phosphate aminotransferase (isomerizing)
MWRVAAARATAATLGVGYLQKKAENCGIVGVVGEADDARDVLLDGLSILQNRGYDSAGMATLKRGTNELAVTKYASKGSTADSIALVRAHAEKHAGHHVGIAHTRWATHGGKTDENAHPHFDAKDRVGVVHNGVIMNADVLRARGVPSWCGGFFFYFEAVPRRREQLQSEGIIFRSQTDTEVIAQLIGRELDAQPDVELRDAVSRSLQKCEGTWGVAVLSVKDPDSVVVACNGSPMNIGLAPGKTFIASETSAFNRHTKNFIAMSRSPRFEVLRRLHFVDGTRVHLTSMRVVSSSISSVTAIDATRLSTQAGRRDRRRAGRRHVPGHSEGGART